MGRNFDPFREMKKLPDLLNKKIETFLSGYKRPFSNIRHGIDSVSVEMRLPNTDKKDINLDIDYVKLTVRTDGNSKNRGEQFFRIIYLPPGLAVERARAAYVNNLLSINIPKNKKRLRVKID